MRAVDAIAPKHLRQDWGEAVDVSAFYGRTSECVSSTCHKFLLFFSAE